MEVVQKTNILLQACLRTTRGNLLPFAGNLVMYCASCCRTQTSLVQTELKNSIAAKNNPLRELRH
jgi:hypothetical protein